jgi:endo-alpha-1,4-polygalactosaminidase (GH114 family)
MVQRWSLALWSVLVWGCSDDGTVSAGGSSGGGTVEPSGDGSAGGSDGDGADAEPEATSGPGVTSDDGQGGSSTGLDPNDLPQDPWRPAPGTTWQWQLVGEIDTSVDVEAYDIDLYDTPEAVIDQLHADGRIVICYFSAGSYEEWREDADAFPPVAIGDPLDGWPGEAWLDHRNPQVRSIMQARLDLAVEKNCDAVEPDNVDGYTNPTGFALTGADQLDYNRFLAAEAHARGLSIGLKNDVEQVADLVDEFDWALNEECVTYDECETTAPFIEQGKAVFHVEYVDDVADGDTLAELVCPQTALLGFSTLIKEWDLTVWRLPCP